MKKKRKQNIWCKTYKKLIIRKESDENDKKNRIRKRFRRSIWTSTRRRANAWRRYPKKIKYTKKLKTDLKRRDFTINTLCINYKEETIDLLNAKKDLDTKTIKLIGKKSRLKDDSLRILRAIRLATILNFNIDEKTSKAIIKYKEYIKLGTAILLIIFIFYICV